MSPSPRIPKADNRNFYFLTLTVIEWINIFTKRGYFEVLKNSLQYCIDKKGLRLFEYVFMTNHIHLIASATEDSNGLDSIIRDFKSFTTHEIWKLIDKDNRQYIVRLLKNSLKMKKGSKKQIWQRENYPIHLESDDFCTTKIQYIHHNPVEKGYVHNPEDWVYSSARQRLLDLPEYNHEVILACEDWSM